jgi:hypothetical protein
MEIIIEKIDGSNNGILIMVMELKILICQRLSLKSINKKLQR